MNNGYPASYLVVIVSMIVFSTLSAVPYSSIASDACSREPGSLRCRCEKGASSACEQLGETGGGSRAVGGTSYSRSRAPSGQGSREEGAYSTGRRPTSYRNSTSEGRSGSSISSQAASVPKVVDFNSPSSDQSSDACTREPQSLRCRCDKGDKGACSKLPRK